MVIVFIFIGNNIIPQTANCAYSETITRQTPEFLWNRANFDGARYLDIARTGYGSYQQTFFPLYPGLIKALNPYCGGSNLIAGLVISWFAFALSLFIFRKLILIDYDEKTALRAILYLLIFPFSFFFSMVYSESLFLFLLLASFYFARTKKWWLAGLFGLLASATRIVGILILPALLVEAYEQCKEENIKIKEKVKSILPLLSIPLGLIYYMRFLITNFQNPLIFIDPSTDKIILLYQVLWRYFKMILTTKLDPLYFSVWLELIVSILFLFIIIKSLIDKKIRLSYLVFAFFAFILPTLSGTFVSMPRFMLVLFPCFIYLARIENKIFKVLFPIICLIIFFIAVSLFTQGYFVG